MTQGETNGIEGKVEVLMLQRNVKRDGALKQALDRAGYQTTRVEDEIKLLDLLRNSDSEGADKNYAVVLEASDAKIAEHADRDVTLGKHYIMMVGYAQSAIESEKDIARKKMGRGELPGAKKMFQNYPHVTNWVSEGRLDAHLGEYTWFLQEMQMKIADTGEYEIIKQVMPLGQLIEQGLDPAEVEQERQRRETAKHETGRYMRYETTDLEADGMDWVGEHTPVPAREPVYKQAVPSYAMPGEDNPDLVEPAKPVMQVIPAGARKYTPESSGRAAEDYSKAGHKALEVRF